METALLFRKFGFCLIFFFYLTHRMPMSSSHYNREEETVHISVYLAKYLSTYLSSTGIFRDNHMLFLTLVLDRLVPIHLLSQKPYLYSAYKSAVRKQSTKIIMTW